MPRPSHYPAGLLLVVALAVTAARCLVGCTAAQGLAVESTLTSLGCELLAVAVHDEQVGTLCSTLAPDVEAEIARALARRDVKPDNLLLGHRARRHSRSVRLLEHYPGRDPGETIEEQYLDAVGRVLARGGGR